MLGDGGNNDQPQHRRKYLRSASWNDRSPTKPNPRPRPSNSRARACLPPLSISRSNVEEWPRAGSDDLGVWPNVQTPRGSVVMPAGELQPDFLFPREKLAFFNKECSRIAEHVYLGSDAVAQNWELLRRNGITHVLNCVGFVSHEYFKSNLVYKTLWLQDSPSEDITSILYDVFDYLEDVREQGGRVLVHCYQGVSRSTSLVIAYLMWREGQSFEDAFQYVKAARGVTNPNMGFACQLLQCQKRVHAVPASPRSFPRMYKMAPHSPYDPLHLVPKMLNHPSAEILDSRGAFIMHIPSAIYVWIGKKCNRLMWCKAEEAARQVIRYEQANGPVVAVKEGEEPSEFWDAFASGELSPNCDDPVEDVHRITFVRDDVAGVTERRISAYDIDFEIYAKALAGGVVPPFSATCSDSVTCLPARENGWDKLKQKFTCGAMKEFVMTAKAKSDAAKSIDTAFVVSDIYDGSDYHESIDDYPRSPSTPSSYPCNSPDSFSCFLRGSLDTCYEDEDSAAFTNPFPSPDSFSQLPLSSPFRSSKSSTLSPSTSEYASSFTFSPSSSNWSDSSYLSSQQTLPSGVGTTDPFSVKRVPLLISPCIPYKERHSSPEVSLDAVSDPVSWKGAVSPSAEELSPVPKKLVRSWSFSLDGEDIIKGNGSGESDNADAITKDAGSACFDDRLEDALVGVEQTLREL